MTTVTLHQLEDLAQAESKTEILLQTDLNTELHIIKRENGTIIKLPFGNLVEIANGVIYIQDKKL